MQTLLKEPQRVIWRMIPISFFLALIIDLSTELSSRPSLSPMLLLWLYASIVLFLTGLGYFLLQEYGGKLLGWATLGQVVLLAFWILAICGSVFYDVLNPGMRPRPLSQLGRMIHYPLMLSYLFYLLNIVVSVFRKMNA